MGKSLAALFGVGGNKNSSKKILKLKTLLSLSVARLSLLKNHHQARCSLAHSDISQLLGLGHSDRALLRAEIVIKEENMLDVFAMIQSYCQLIGERSLLLQRQKDCPHELKEAVSSLIYASSRSGEMPELQHVCNLFSAMFGREFVRAATELRNSCGVNPKIVQKLSTKQPSLESRVRIIKEIAAEKGITLDLTDEDPLANSEIAKLDPPLAKKKNQSNPVVDSVHDSSPGRVMHNYKDVASAAQAACEKAEDAAAAARAAVELSRSSQSSDDNDNRGNNDEKKKKEDENLDKAKVHSVQYYTSESEEEEEEEEETVFHSDKHREISDGDKFQTGFSSDSTDAPLPEKKLNRFGSWDSTKNKENNVLFDNKSENETEKLFNTDSNPLYQNKYPARKFRKSFKSSWQQESDTTGLLDSTDDENLAKSYYLETRSPQNETIHINYTKKSPAEQAKVMRRAVSVRTRRGMQK